MLCPERNGAARPDATRAGACLGITPELDPRPVFDVAVVGAGPAGLADRGLRGSEGLSVLVLDRRAFGGQAGRLGADRELSRLPDRHLRAGAGRPRLQPGAEVRRRDRHSARGRAARLQANGQLGAPLRLELTDGDAVRARTVVVATGARYRRPAIANLASFEGAGVCYWASPIEAKLCAGEEVALVGGGNSAGQAVVFLAPQGQAPAPLVRGAGSRRRMSRYLIERIAALPNVELHTEHRGRRRWKATRSTGLTGAVFRDRSDRRDTAARSAICSCSSAPIRTPPGSTAALRSTTRASC